MTEKLYACPICGGRIQSTEENYRDNLVLSADAKDVVDNGSSVGSGERAVYCENDHSQQAMIDFVRDNEPLANFDWSPYEDEDFAFTMRCDDCCYVVNGEADAWKHFQKNGIDHKDWTRRNGEKYDVLSDYAIGVEDDSA